MRSVSVGRSPAITSSSSNSLGSVASARATSSRLRSGSVRCAAVDRACRTDRDGAAPSRACARAAPTSRRRSSAPTMTLSSTLSAGNGRTIWKVRAMPRRHTASGVSPSIGAPAKVIDAVVGRERAGDHVEQRGLAGAVRADHGENRAFGHIEADAVDGDQAAKALADAFEVKEARSSADAPRRRAVAPATAKCRSGSATTRTKRQMP